MINIYSKTNTDFTKNGNATLIPIRADLSITLNGSWALEIEVPYDREGRWELIEEGAVIQVDVNCIRELSNTRQRFRIYDYKKGISSVTAIAFPVAMESTHDAPIDNLVISSKTGVQAMAQIQAKTNKYTLYSDITRTGSTSFANTNVNNAIASGSDGCFIDVWGGEIVYDNFKFSVLNRVGNDEQNKHKIIYGKDITDISYEKDDSGLITRIYPISSDGIRLNGSGYVDSPKVSQYPIVHSRYMSAPYKLIEDDIASSTATAQLTRSIKSQITTLASSLSHSVYNTAVASKVEPEYIRKIKADILSAVQSMATANIYNADANKVMQSAIKDGMEWLKDVSKAEWVWHGSDATGWWYGSSTSDRATSQYVYIDRVWNYFGDNSLWQKPRNDASKKWDWIQEAGGKRYGNKDKYYAQKTYVYITMDGQMKEYWFDDDGYWDGSDDTDSSYAWHGSGTSADPWWFGEDGATSEDTNKFLHGGWWFIDGTYYYFDEYGYYDGTTKFENYQWDWVEASNSKWWFGNDANRNFARVYVTNQWLKVGGDWYRFDGNGYAVGDTALENEVIARFTSGMAQLKTLCETLNTQAFNLLYSQMRSYCTKMFNTGIDVPSVTITVNMADLSNTSEYAKYQHLEKVYLGDSVTALDYKHNISAVERIVSITYDCIKKVNAVVEIGVASSSLSDILKTEAGGSVAGGFDTSVIESTLTSHTNELARLDSAKQDKLTAGTGIEINGNVISSTASGHGLEYWEETSEDFSREETSELPDRFTAKSEYIFTDSEWSVTDRSSGETYRTYKKQTGRAVCGRFTYWDWLFGAYYVQFYGYAYISTIEDAVKYSEGGSSTPWGTKTINGVIFYVSSNVSMCQTDAYNLVPDSIPHIGDYESYEDAVDALIALADIKAGNQYLDTGIGIGDNIIWGGNRYDDEEGYPFYVDNEGKIHAKSITVDNVTAETINAEEVISDEHNVLADFIGATSSVDGVHGLVPAPTTNDVGKVLFADGRWRSIGTDIEDIFSIFDTTNINSQYSSGTLTSDSFSFSVNENNNSWSASATAYNNTAFDVTDYNSLIIEVDVTEQSDYGAFWVTLSQTKYTWGTGSWVGVYYNVDSAIKITESGQYEIDVSALSGSYYIYIGASTGKATVTRGDCVNSQNGKIIGTVTAFKGIKLNGIVPNPTESATDKLKKIKIEDVVYEIADIEGVTEEEYADLPSTKNSDNVLYMVRSVEDIFDGGSTITLTDANGVTLQESAVSGNVGTLKAYEYSAGHEGFNIALKNLTVGNTYKLEFDFQFTSAQFIGTDYRCAYLISATQKTNYSDYGQWTENIPRNLQKHHHSVEFTATVTTMYVAFNLDGCSDSVNNYFTMSNIYVIDVDSKNKIMYNGNQYGASAGGGASAVSDLTDVDLTNLSNGQILKYNSTTQKWENANESGGSGNLSAQEITYAQWQALTEEQKMAEVEYHITDYPDGAVFPLTVENGKLCIIWQREVTS